MPQGRHDKRAHTFGGSERRRAEECDIRPFAAEGEVGRVDDPHCTFISYFMDEKH